MKISGKFVNSSHVVLVDDWQCQDNRDEFSTLDLLIPTSHLSHQYFCDGFLTYSRKVPNGERERRTPFEEKSRVASLCAVNL